MKRSVASGEMFSEDIDMSTRIRNAGFRISLYPDVYVYHKKACGHEEILEAGPCILHVSNNS